MKIQYLTMLNFRYNKCINCLYGDIACISILCNIHKMSDVTYALVLNIQFFFFLIRFSLVELIIFYACYVCLCVCLCCTCCASLFFILIAFFNVPTAEHITGNWNTICWSGMQHASVGLYEHEPN